MPMRGPRPRPRRAAARRAADAPDVPEVAITSAMPASTGTAVDAPHTVRVDDDRRSRAARAGAARSGADRPDVDRQHRGSDVARRTQDREPRPARRQRHSDEVAGAERGRAQRRSCTASVPRTARTDPCGLPSTSACASNRDQREVHRIVEWVATGEWEDIRYETAGGIAKLTINRPEVRNAFRPTTLFELARAFEMARDDPEIGVIVLTGEGPDAFCSGGDQRIRGDDGYRDAAGVGRLNVLDLQVQIRRLPEAGRRDGRRLRDRRRPRAPPRVRPDHRRRQRALRSDRDRRSARSTPATDRGCSRGPSGSSAPRRSGSSASSTTPSRPSAGGSSIASSRSTASRRRPSRSAIGCSR